MEVQGKIKVIGKTESVGSNGFTKRQLVVETEEQYPQQIGIDFVKDKCVILDKYKVGQSVKVSINIRGNEYNGKYYVNLQGWRIESVLDAPNIPIAPNKDISNDEQENLPF